MSRRFRGEFDNGVAWDKVPDAPKHPENWTNPSVPPLSTEDLSGRYVDGVPGSLEASENKNHRDFGSKREALKFLEDHAMMSVGWPEGGGRKEACYWNGKVHVTKADEKTRTGASRRVEDELKEFVGRFGNVGSVLDVDNPNYNRWHQRPEEPERVEAKVTGFGEKNGAAVVDFERTDGGGHGDGFWSYATEVGGRTKRRVAAEGEVKVGDYVSSRQGEGYLIAELPTGEFMISMNWRAKTGRRVGLDEISRVIPKGEKGWKELEASGGGLGRARRGSECGGGVVGRVALTSRTARIVERIYATV